MRPGQGRRTMCDALGGHLAHLKMPAASLRGRGNRPPPGSGGPSRPTLLFTANAGLSPQPMTKVASGGERSRVMLALKAALSVTLPCPRSSSTKSTRASAATWPRGWPTSWPASPPEPGHHHLPPPPGRRPGGPPHQGVQVRGRRTRHHPAPRPTMQMAESRSWPPCSAVRKSEKRPDNRPAA